MLACSHQIAVGTKSGQILMYDLPSSTLIETIEAHTATIWSMHVRADGEALVTGSADKDVKFWKFEHRDATDGSVSAKMVVLTLLLNIVLGSKWKTFIATPHTYTEDDG